MKRIQARVGRPFAGYRLAPPPDLPGHGKGHHPLAPHLAVKGSHQGNSAGIKGPHLLRDGPRPVALQVQEVVRIITVLEELRMCRPSAFRILRHLHSDGPPVAKEPACRPPVVAAANDICRITVAEIAVGPGLLPDQRVVVLVMPPLQKQTPAVGPGIRLPEDVIEE